MSNRRDFVRLAGGCMAHLAIASALAPRSVRAAWAGPRGHVVAQEKFGRLERIDASTWALISTPLTGDRTTLSNGGIVAGRSGVLAIEGFVSPEGARWLALRARELTGRWPTHVVTTHYHADHVNGIAGYLDPDARTRPEFLASPRTRELALRPDQSADAARADALNSSRAVLDSDQLDLGDRVVHISNMSGHTASDLVIEDRDRAIVFCGDLVWNAMVPNYVDADPQALRSAVRGLERPGAVTYVPGHGALAKTPEFTTYALMLDAIEAGARAAHAAGRSAQEGAAAFGLPDSLGEWVLFNSSFFQRAFEAWYRVL